MTPQDVEQILQWPPDLWSPREQQRIGEYRAAVHREMYALVDTAEKYDRPLNDDESERYGALTAEYERLASLAPSPR